MNLSDKNLYLIWNAKEYSIEVAQKYNQTEDIILRIKPYGINKIMNILTPKLIKKGTYSNAQSFDSSYFRENCENIAESDWLGPHYINYNWYGGTHGTIEDKGNPTGFSNNFSLFINHEKRDIKENITEYINCFELIWDTYIYSENKENCLLLEKHSLISDGKLLKVKTDITFLNDIKWMNYYGMQCVYGMWNDTVSYDYGEKFIINQNAKDNPITTESNFKRTQSVLLQKNNDCLEMFLNPSNGIGNRKYLNEKSGAFTVTYNDSLNGKAYFSLVRGDNSVEMKSGDTASFSGSYRFFYQEENQIEKKFYLTKDNSKINGRTTFSDKTLNLIWTNSGFELYFKGTGISSMLQNKEISPMVAFKIDDEPFRKLEVNKPYERMLASGLEYGIHKLTFLKISEISSYPLEIPYIKVYSSNENQPELLPPPKDNDKKIMFIGDSITCGYDNLSEPTERDYVVADQDGLLTYASLSAKMLSLDARYICSSGKGIYHNCDATTNNLLPQLFEKISLTDNSKWEYDGWNPQIIVINAGTNDVWGGATQEGFENSAFNFLKTIRNVYKNSKIIWCYGMMNLEMSDAIFNSVEKFNKIYGNITYLKFEPITNGEIGGNGHPNVKAHERCAEILSKLISSLQ